jgi:hypothetical protein
MAANCEVVVFGCSAMYSSANRFLTHEISWLNDDHK